MMAFSAGVSLLVALFWITFFCPTLGNHAFKARIRVNKENAVFLRFHSPVGNVIDILKLIHDPISGAVYAGTPHSLYMLNRGEYPELNSVNVSIEHSECPGCRISLLKEGRNGNSLFMCVTGNEVSKCCDVSSAQNPEACTKLMHPPHISESSLHVGNSLYYTISSNSEQSLPSGIYRWAMDKATFSVLTQNEQRYFKIIANNSNGSSDRKVYTFYIEKTQDQGPEKPIWVPLVSQICMADRGGSKSVLQNRWTSMLTARLFCGDEKKHLSYTELLDIAVLEDAEWQNTTIYTLFKNDYNLTALCVYTMSDILNVFQSNEFTSGPVSFSPRPGECVENSQVLSPSLLRFMESRPELKQWIKPVRNPLLFKHHHYTHLQVDRVKSGNLGNGHHDVLLMSLECGKVHKILEQNGEPFIIAEYEPFSTRTHISSMLLNSENKQLFVSSSSEVIQINLHNCSMYGKCCKSCVMARDPCCSWDNTKCSNIGSGLQEVTHGNHSICKDECTEPRLSKSSTIGKRDNSDIIPQDSKFFLKCPTDSQHASYVWEHQNMEKECVLDEQNCFLLIDRMSEKDEGMYKCISSENGYSRTIVSMKLQMKSGSDTRTSHTALVCLLLLIYVIY